MSLTKVTSNVINDVDASKLTGSIADARVPASAVTQHSDTSSIENDIAVLALQNAINGNMTAHGLNNYWIEQFEDSDSITSLTNVFRDTASEYISTGSWGSTQNLWEVSSSGTAVGSGWNNYTTRTRITAISATAHRLRFTVNTTGAGDLIQAGFGVADSGSTHGSTNYDTVATPLEIKWGGTSGASGASQVSDWLTFTVSSSNDYIFTATTGDNTNIFWYTSGLPTDTESCTQAPGTAGFGTLVADVPTDSGYGYVYFLKKIEGQESTLNATGSFTSTTITPQDSASKSSLGLCLLYKNNAGTNTLNTDIIAKVSADNGSNYSTCVLASKGTFSTGINIAIAPAISVTSGNQLKYKIEFANQSAGSKEGQIHGVALSY